MIKQLLTLVLVGLFGLAHGQNTNRKILGSVQDAETGEPVAFASVGIQDKPFSTVTNLNGEFSFNIPRSDELDFITISSIGYELQKVALNDFKNDEMLLIKLSPSKTILDAIVVVDSLSANEIMKLAMERISENHPSEPVSMNVFYRERQLMDGAYVSLVEAAVTIYDEYNLKRRKSPLRTKVRIDELRRSLVYKHPFNSWWQQDNLMMHSWMLNPIPSAAKTLERSAKKEEFKRVGMTTVLGKSAFIIETDNDDFWKTTYYVQSGTYAIVRVEGNFDESIDGSKHWEMQGDSLQLDIHFKKRHVTVDFKKVNDKFHPIFIQLDASHHYYHEDKFLADYGIIQDFVIHHIEFENPIKVERNEAARIGKSLLSKDYPYNVEFWENYNVLKETPLERKLIKDLEQRPSSLTKQFIFNQKATNP